MTARGEDRAHGDVIPFTVIAKKLGISKTEAASAYASAMEKIRANPRLRKKALGALSSVDLNDGTRTSGEISFQEAD